MQRRATWIVVMAAVAVSAAVLVLPRTASANWFPRGRYGAIRLARDADLHPGAIGHVGPYFRWTWGMGTLGVPNSGGLRTRTTGWPWPTVWPPDTWRLTIADNNTPLPTDRVFFSYTHFPTIRLDLNPKPAPEPPTPPPEKPKKPRPVVINDETVGNFLDQNLDADTAKKYKGLLQGLNAHNAPPP